MKGINACSSPIFQAFHTVFLCPDLNRKQLRQILCLEAQSKRSTEKERKKQTKQQNSHKTKQKHTSTTQTPPPTIKHTTEVKSLFVFPFLFPERTYSSHSTRRLNPLKWNCHTEYQKRLCRPQNPTQTSCFIPQKLQKHLVICLIYTLNYEVWTSFISDCSSPTNAHHPKTWPKSYI